jgi:hypothetical protein
LELKEEEDARELESSSLERRKNEDAMHLAELQAEEQRVERFVAQLRAGEEARLQEELKEEEDARELESSSLELERRKNEDAMHLAELQAEEQRVERFAAQLLAGEEARLQEEEDARELESSSLELEERKNEDAAHWAELQAEEQWVERFATQLRAGEEARLQEEDVENSSLDLERRKNEDAMHLAELQAEEQRVELLAAQLRAGEEAKLKEELQEKEDAREQKMLNIAYVDDIGVADNLHSDGEYANKDQEDSVVLQGDLTKARHPNCMLHAEGDENDSDNHTSHKQTLPSPVFVTDYLYDNDPDYPSTREEKEIVAIGVEFSSELQSMIQQYDKSSAHRNTTSESSPSGISGYSPPPLDLSPSEQGDWEFLNRSVRTADALEVSLPMKEYESKLVDLRAVSLAGAVCKAVGSRSVRLKAKSFYYWKYEHVGGVEAVGPVFKFIEASASTASDQSVMFTPGRPLRASYGSDTLGSTSRLDAGMRFAIKVLDKHSRRMKILSRLGCLQRTWQILKSTNSTESHTLDFSDIVEEAYAEEVLHTEASPLGAAATSSGEFMSPSSEHKRFHAMTKALTEAEVDAEEEGCSEDLLLLGAMPAVLTCVFKANEVSGNCVHFMHCTHS